MLFGVRKPLFLGMRRFCLLSEVSWETVFLFEFMYSIYLFLITNNYAQNNKYEPIVREVERVKVNPSYKR